MIYVAAGTYAQFEQYCQENELRPNKDAKYIGYYFDLQGVHNQKYTITGTFWFRRDADDIYDTLIARQMVQV